MAVITVGPVPHEYISTAQRDYWIVLQQMLAQGLVQLLGWEASCCRLWDGLEQTALRVYSGHLCRHASHTWHVCTPGIALQALL